MNRRDGEQKLFQILLIVLIIFLILGIWGPQLGVGSGKSEALTEDTYELDPYLTYGWIMCQPKDCVNIRMKANKKARIIGTYETGDYFIVSDTTRKGWIFCEKLSLEETEGWIFGGYVVYDQPIPKGGAYYTVKSRGRVACRKWIDGPRRTWVRNGNTVRVWYWSEEWCVTNKGFIKTEYLEENTPNGYAGTSFGSRLQP